MHIFKSTQLFQLVSDLPIMALKLIHLMITSDLLTSIGVYFSFCKSFHMLLLRLGIFEQHSFLRTGEYRLHSERSMQQRSCCIFTVWFHQTVFEFWSCAVYLLFTWVSKIFNLVLIAFLIVTVYWGPQWRKGNLQVQPHHLPEFDSCKPRRVPNLQLWNN